MVERVVASAGQELSIILEVGRPLGATLGSTLLLVAVMININSSFERPSVEILTVQVAIV